MASIIFGPPKETETPFRGGTEEPEVKPTVKKIIIRESVSRSPPASKEDIVFLKHYFLAALFVASSIIILVAWLLRH